MTERVQQRYYDDRLATGDVVYLVEGHDPHRPDQGRLLTKKATVIQDCQNGAHYVVVKRWVNLYSPPVRAGISTVFDASELFTESEVADEIESRQATHEHLGEMSLRSILMDVSTNRELAELLQAAIQDRATTPPQPS